MRFQVAYEAAGLLDQLDIVLRLETSITREQAVHFVYKRDPRAVLFCAREQFRKLLHGRTGRATKNIGGGDRIETTLGQGCDQATNHGFPVPGGPISSSPVGTGNFNRSLYAGSISRTRFRRSASVSGAITTSFQSTSLNAARSLPPVSARARARSLSSILRCS